GSMVDELQKVNSEVLGRSPNHVGSRNRITRAASFAGSRIQRTLICVTNPQRVLPPVIPDLLRIDIPFPIRAFGRLEESPTNGEIVCTNCIRGKPNRDLIYVSEAGFIERAASLAERRIQCPAWRQ